ncbi:MAG: MFS transporter [Deltaproteobacteria bacterium CG11_big_fil_rev_8_21_14_0_20_42_23]|nr:MAG: MFS transporter [Deltaproteobacteria bacterium CG11_big_fil_rev_8_21_14_0_20_42_23]PJC63499.1 MAG: MFS transporter [Deltaproteobacteria bacterium CG_4_9_14_0_2_um_filter_42_21]
MTALVSALGTKFKHPKGLYILFFTEMWERFSYYGMRAILVLYLVAETKNGPMGGLGWSKGDALALYGWYTMLVYVASIPGGWLADRVFGARKAVMFGGLLLCIGHFLLAFHGLFLFYTSLGFIIAGVGLLKPNISTLVGTLYAPGDPMRDKGFTTFYIGINVGAFLSSFVVGTVGELIGWHYGFALAGVGMLLGQAVFVWGQKYIISVDHESGINQKLTDAQKNIPLTRIEKDRMGVMFLSFLIVVVFWGAFEQAGGLMNLYTLEKTNRFLLGWEIPASWFQSLNPFFIMIFGTMAAQFWYVRAKLKKESSSLYKMALGTMIMGFGFVFMVFATMQTSSGTQASMIWLILAYLFHTIGELFASPVALSFITKLAPVKYASLMMGVYFATTGFGNKLAGLLGEWSENAGEFAIFGGIAAFTILFGLIMIAFLKPLKRLTHGAEDETPPPSSAKLAKDEIATIEYG